MHSFEIETLRLIVDPAVGGSIRRLDRRAGSDWVPVMRPTPDAADAVLAMACFPLVPFSNRIADATFDWEGRTVSLPKNFPPEPHAIHGQGWENPWSVAARTETSVDLAFDWPGGDWPWPYQARQSFALQDDALSVDIAVTNLGTGPMPAGLGVHPQFPRPPGTRITFESSGYWRSDDRFLPAALEPLPAHLDLPGGQVLDAVTVDNCFAGWRGAARIDWPDGSSVTVTADASCGHLVFYVPPGQHYLSVEPVTHASNAIHLAAGGRTDTGLVVLAPGETLATSIRFQVGLP